MHITLGKVRLRKPELSDLDTLYRQKNDPEVASLLGGFTTGYTRHDIAQWIEAHGAAKDEALYIITDHNDICLGHVGLYDVSFRLRSAVFGIMIGDRASWGSGIGRACTDWALRFGFNELALHRISLQVLETNVRAIALYESLGFQYEGRLRHARWIAGSWVDLVAMSLLEDEWKQRDR